MFRRCFLGAASSSSPSCRTEEQTCSALQRLMHHLSTAPASERGAAPSLASYRRPCLLLESGQPGPNCAAWSMPKRVPARGRGRETELCIILQEGEEREFLSSLCRGEGERSPFFFTLRVLKPLAFGHGTTTDSGFDPVSTTDLYVDAWTAAGASDASALDGGPEVGARAFGVVAVSGGWVSSDCGGFLRRAL